MRCPALMVAIVGVFVCAVGARADSWPDSCLPATEGSACPKDGAIWSFQFLSGYYQMTELGPGEALIGKPAKVNYLPQAGRIGCENPHVLFPGCWLEGTCQALLEYNGSPILRDFGSYFTGPCAILRYNFRRDDSCLIPYLQGGAGLVLTDAHQELRQHLIGQAVEFLLRVEVGVRFRLTETFSLDVEGGLQHVSNAGLASRNGGINDLGLSVGFTYEFGRK
jgi:hypothetical protein